MLARSTELENNIGTMKVDRLWCARWRRRGVSGGVLSFDVPISRSKHRAGRRCSARVCGFSLRRAK